MRLTLVGGLVIVGAVLLLIYFLRNAANPPDSQSGASKAVPRDRRL